MEKKKAKQPRRGCWATAMTEGCAGAGTGGCSFAARFWRSENCA